ncbi:FtsW/RodA/SpoVE family cell cycle protein [Paenibacillus lautus]|uniref:Rod shape-determining protein RodA n=1 Tax=Paenibacillus lautus TaxID=1401 RepID=A0A385TKU3_PAELA|nr:FtsW/RodA/SpoVE family cell cycle protein [Paenibacillus lautus]AYB41815.1 rod shape-determining protein RodA [Paenibacillus lautus]MBY0163347.1 rod shape-determining protein RodA [Cytobacillus firmus]MCI1774396.1 rod shape-determining protein RodA [Paenibacillus lautus]VTR46199.1 rod shape-determining protein RodA [Actinobacillus pleuropneumoniae]
MLQKFKKIDFVIVFVLLMLMVVSITSIYSATFDTVGFEGHHIKMAVFYILGFAAFFGLSLIDYRIWNKYALHIYIGGLVTLLLPSFIGQTKNNATGWINLGIVDIQPAELFKLVLIIFITYVLIRKDKSRLSFWRDIVPIGFLTFIPFAIVMVQNDLGNGLSYIVILLGLLWIGNVKFSHALIGLLLVAGIAFGGAQAYIHFHDEIKESKIMESRGHWMERIDPWLVPEKATAKASYHTNNAKLAIASGGMSGEGYLEGSSVQSSRVPYTYSDSIFVQIAEEYGFIGSSVLLLLYFILIHRMILISLESREKAGPFLIIGIVAMLLYQIFENIGMFIGLMPLTGITLPFISYGGTSLIINMACLGVAMSVKLHGQEVEEDMPNPQTYRSAPTKQA